MQKMVVGRGKGNEKIDVKSFEGLLNSQIPTVIVFEYDHLSSPWKGLAIYVSRREPRQPQ